MECPNCKLINPPESVQCDCGYDFLTATIPVTPEHRENPPLTGTIPSLVQLGENAPYASFVSLLLGSYLLISVLVFDVAHALARSRWESTTSAVVAIVSVAFLAAFVRRAWRRVIVAEPAGDPMFARRHRRVLWTSTVIAMFFVSTAAVVGAAIGQSRAEAARLSSDVERMNTVGGRISRARNAVEHTIASYVQMYKAIEPDVQELESTLQRVRIDLGIYDAKFPGQDEETHKSIASVETEQRRAALLKRQIEVAKQLDALDPNQQLAVWHAQMQPLLAEEEGLDKSK
jgi:hypothetical protein